MKIRQPTVNLITSEEYISPNECKPARHLAGGDVYEQARRIPHGGTAVRGFTRLPCET